MLDLHPDRFKVEWARVLLAAGLEPVTPRQLQRAIKTRFHKDYPLTALVENTVHNGPLLTFIDELCGRGLLEYVEGRPNVLQVTRYGLEHVGMIEYLARVKPDPYRKFTRPSYSPNCATEHTTETQEDITIPAPTSWNKRVSLNSSTW